MRLRAAMIGAIGAFLMMVAFFGAGSPVQAVGTGNCDPFDVNCLRTRGLYGQNICAAGNTNCLKSYQALGVPVCAPGDATCAATYAAVIAAGGATSTPVSVIGAANASNSSFGAAPPPPPYQSGGFPVGGDTSNKPVFTISTPTAVVALVVNGTVVSSAPTSVTGRYGIDVCPMNDNNCLLTQQMQGVPVCPPGDDACRRMYNGVYKPIPTFGYGVGTPRPDQNQDPASSGSRRYIVGGSTDATGAAGIIVVSR